MRKIHGGNISIIKHVVIKTKANANDSHENYPTCKNRENGTKNLTKRKSASHPIVTYYWKALSFIFQGQVVTETTTEYREATDDSGFSDFGNSSAASNFPGLTSTSDFGSNFQTSSKGIGNKKNYEENVQKISH